VSSRCADIATKAALNDATDSITKQRGFLLQRCTAATRRDTDTPPSQTGSAAMDEQMTICTSSFIRTLTVGPGFSPDLLTSHVLRPALKTR
jgi:hypothetical protein